MARHRDVRSPSPVGSSHSTSKRSRRNDDHYERSRADDRSRRDRRTRSRSPDRRYRDRDSHRRDRSRDRREDDYYRSSQRDRSRDRRRSRDRDVARDYRRRSRDADRSRRDSSRDRTRRRRDGSTDSRKNGRRDDSRDRGSGRRAADKKELPAKPPPVAPTEEEKKAERLAKLDAWKKSLAAGKEKKQKETEGAAGTRSLLDEIDKRAAIQAATPVTSSPVSAPAVEDSAAKEPPTEDATVKESSPVPYAGKFDPKAIAKKVASSHTASKLGTDLVVPGKVKASAASNSTQNGLKANDSKATAKSTSNPAPKGTTKARGHVSGFGLAAKSHTEPEKSSNKRGLDLDEEEGSRKKLEKLPTPPPENGAMNEDAALANGTKDEDADDDEDADLQDAGTEEEAAAAARAAAEKREERLQAQSLAYQTGEANAQVNGDTEMTDAPQIPDTTPMEVVEEQEEQEEIDPLDAFMTDLGDPMAHPSKGKSFKKTKPKAQEAEALFGDDDATDLKAVEADPDDILSMASKRKKKDLPAVNHAKISYDPFRKAFYHEPLELANMTEEEVAELRLELDGIKVRGIDVPKPVQKWSQCGLGVQTLNVIHNVLKYEKPSPIQMQACPAIMAGRDVIGVAKTGSGKTIAFLLPMFRHIKDQRPLDMLEGPIALIMTPTRELATQIHKECKHFLKALNLRAVCAYGGAPIKDQIADLKRGAEIIVATPGRFIDLLAANGGRVTNLRRVTYIVLDESDRLWDMGFEPQISRILQNIRPDRQTVLFSATFPRTIEALARKALSKPVEIVVGGRSVVASEITQIVHVLPEESKFVRLLELLGNLYSDEKNEDDRALIFVNQQSSCDTLLRDLMRKGYPCLSLHGGKDQIERDDAISDFKAGVVPIMIATSVAARGLDVKQLTLVINYDPPNHYEDLVHRAGRTGRAGAKGTAVTFLTEDQERYSIDIAKALKQSGQEVPEDVQKLVTQFTEKVKAGKEKASGSGFGGKGLERLDQERDAARNRERKTYKTGEEGEDEDKDEKDAGDDLVAKAASTVQPASGGSSLMPAPASAQLPGVPKGIDLDGKITVHKTEVPSSGGAKNPLDKVSAAVASINTRLSNTGVLRQGVPIDNKGPDAGAFHATLEINDFPQKARWAVTNRTNVAKILEATGTSITTKGSFYGAGKEPQAGENPKLYILVEGDTEVVVTNAMRELMRLLKEGTIAAADSDARAPTGRYNVL